jgi:flagella basal body P-ring formation protein FlgA
MIRTFMTILAALVALGGAAAAQVTAALDQGRPTLKAEATVTGEFVRIGDLVANAGAAADIPIFRAPDLGATGTVAAEAVLAAVRPHALPGLVTGGLSEVEVTRASRAITAKDVEDAIARSLAAQFALGEAKSIAITFDRMQRTLHVAPNARGELRVNRMSYEAHNGRFNVALDVPTGPTTYAPLRLTGRAVATVEVATLTQTVERGAILRDSDVTIERRPRAEIGRDVVADRAQVIGLAARTVLHMGRPLRMTQLMRPQLVKRNEYVTIVYEMPGIMLTVRGRATEAGAEGDMIAVLNEQSKRTMHGVVAGPGRVVIGSSSPRTAAHLASPAKPSEAR